MVEFGAITSIVNIYPGSMFKWFILTNVTLCPVNTERPFQLTHTAQWTTTFYLRYLYLQRHNTCIQQAPFQKGTFARGSQACCNESNKTELVLPQTLITN